MPRPNPKAPQSQPPPVLIGVLGGIGSGKSLVGGLLAGSAGVVIDADRLAHAALEGPQAAKFLVSRFGPEVLDDEGRPIRAALAELVFQNPEHLRALEAWTHPIVRARIYGEIAAARDSHRSPIVLDVPLLLENDAQHGLVRECKHLVFVDSDEAEREKRTRTNRNWKPGELQRREASQWSMEEKRKAASHVISNREGVLELKKRIHQLRNELKLD